MRKALHKRTRKGRRGAAPPPPAAPAPTPSADTVTAAFSRALGAHQGGRLDQAQEGYREVLRQNPTHPHANNNMAILMRGIGRPGDALAFYRAAIAGAPEDPQIRSNLGCALVDMGQNSEAAARLNAALALNPTYPEALFNLGNVLRNLDRPDLAAAAYLRALRVKPDLAEAQANLGDIHKAKGELSTAEASFRAALDIRPDMLEPSNNLGETLKERGLIEEAIAVFEQGARKHPDSALIHSNLLFALHYTSAIPPEVIARAHRHWDERHALPRAPADPGHANDRDPGRRLRVGYVSPDFCAHSCAYFSEPLLRAHDKTRFEIFCYPTSRREDVVTRRFREVADHWRPLVGMSDEAAAALIRQDRIDILVDLAGHTCDARPLTFAHRPAPVQVSWLGYPDTTGMTAMDYRLTDAVADPPGECDDWHSERLVRLEGGFLTYQSIVDEPLEEIPPALGRGWVTFGSFNNTAKVTPEVVRVWSEILKRTPNSRLIVKSRPLGDEPTRRRYAALFEAQGVGSDRVELLTRMEPVNNHLRAYNRIDVALDPFPYNGTTTTCEALWMGVPVVTLAGRNHVSRVGASLLTHCGLGELVTGSEDAYVACAMALADDLNRLAELRRGMRDRLLAAPLTDHDGFARRVEAAYREMWRNWLVGGGA